MGAKRGHNSPYRVPTYRNIDERKSKMKIYIHIFSQKKEKHIYIHFFSFFINSPSAFVNYRNFVFFFSLRSSRRAEFISRRESDCLLAEEMFVSFGRFHCLIKVVPARERTAASRSSRSFAAAVVLPRSRRSPLIILVTSTAGPGLIRIGLRDWLISHVALELPLLLAVRGPLLMSLHRPRQRLPLPLTILVEELVEAVEQPPVELTTKRTRTRSKTLVTAPLDEPERSPPCMAAGFSSSAKISRKNRSRIYSIKFINSM